MFKVRYLFEIALVVIGAAITLSNSMGDITFFIGCALMYTGYKIEATIRRKEYEKRCIENQVLFKGETPDQVLESWGEPHTTFNTSEGTQWCYGPRGISGSQFKARITFKKGRVSRFTREQKDF